MNNYVLESSTTSSVKLVDMIDIAARGVVARLGASSGHTNGRTSGIRLNSISDFIRSQKPTSASQRLAEEFKSVRVAVAVVIGASFWFREKNTARDHSSEPCDGCQSKNSNKSPIKWLPERSCGRRTRSGWPGSDINFFCALKEQLLRFPA